ncbi:MAG: 16S rRNA (cytidine(1402)-2'-O)-methyltransferase [Actinomycetaceae bacterium]|nr:16S rRNA (cytidine(1402)-2'-O)-methyltransferase [Arcanobacterium sp.]MDD7505589.1 16S rRNA (cytidine(1402)-2'-O)-methyltransferase [Actinomycetaceae bacterium]
MITLAATPIGNDLDASPRFRRAIEEADVIAAEDTRRFLNLAGRLGINLHAKVIAFHDHNEADKSAALIEAARNGREVVVVSDAGMPVISDPGFRLVRLAAQAGYEVNVIPGPSAVLTALALSGIAAQRFTFEGFAPRKAADRAREFASLAREPRTMIYFESPRRLGKTLAAMRDAFGGDRQGAVCRELTKIHQEVRRGTLAELAQWAEGEILGEIVIVVSGRNASTSSPSLAANPDVAARSPHAVENDCENLAENISPELVTEVGELVQLGVRAKAAAGHIAKREGLRPNELFAAYLAAK